MYNGNLVRVHRIERRVTDFPRVKLEVHPMADTDRFCLKVNMRNITVDTDGSLVFWIDRGDVNNLHLDCSTALLEDDIEVGLYDVETVVGS